MQQEKVFLLKEAEELFLEIVNDCNLKIYKDHYPNSIFYFKGNKCFFEIEKVAVIYCSFNNFWYKIYKLFSNDSQITREFISSMFKKHFKIKKVTIHNWCCETPQQFEKYFKKSLL